MLDQPQPPPASAGDRSLYRRPWFWVVGGLLAALIVATGILIGHETASSSHPQGALPAAGGSPSAKQASGTSTTTPPPGNGYIATAPGQFVIFMQWNRSGSTVDGTVEVVAVTGQPPNAITESKNGSVTGTVHGSSISLSIDGSTLQFGTMTGGSFTMNFPNSDGTLVPVTFRSASVAAYDTAINSLKGDVSSANRTASNIQARQAHEQAITNEANTVLQDISTLSQQESATNTDVQAIAGSLQTAASDLSSTQQAAQQVEGEAGTTPHAQVCSDAASVSSDAFEVGSDAAEVESDARSVESDLSGQIGGLRVEISQLQATYTQLGNDESSLPGFTPSNAPSQGDVSNAIASANSAIQAALSTTNNGVDQANSDVSAAFQAAAQASQSGGCGNNPTPPSAEQHIS